MIVAQYLTIGAALYTFWRVILIRPVFDRLLRVKYVERFIREDLQMAPSLVKDTLCRFDSRKRLKQEFWLLIKLVLFSPLVMFVLPWVIFVRKLND